MPSLCPLVYALPMGAGASSANEREIERQALVATLDAAFAAGRLRWLSDSSLYATAVPSLALWIHARRPLPELVAWFAALGWVTCAGLALVSGVAAWRAQARFAGARPKSASVAMVSLALASPLSAGLAAAAASASSVLWLNAVFPARLSADLLALGWAAWPFLAGLALAVKAFQAGPDASL